MVFRLIQIRVMNRPGVLSRITQTVLRPGYNIETMTLMGTDDPEYSIITIGINYKDVHEASLMARKLANHIDVEYAIDITDGPKAFQQETKKH